MKAVSGRDKNSKGQKLEETFNREALYVGTCHNDDSRRRTGLSLQF